MGYSNSLNVIMQNSLYAGMLTPKIEGVVVGVGASLFQKEFIETNDFKGSTGWFFNFCKRRKLTLRIVTS